MGKGREVEGVLTATLLARLSSDPKPDAERDMLVLAALDGPEALAGLSR